MMRIFAFLMLLCGPAHAQTDVTPDTWAASLRAPNSTELALAPGIYPATSISNLRGPLWVRAADPANPPRLRGLVLKRAADITFEGVVFDYVHTPGDAPHLRPFAIEDSRRIAFERVRFEGDLGTDGFPTAFGLSVTGSRYLRINGAVMTGFLRGMIVDRTADMAITGSDISGMRSDGLNFAQVKRIQISGNHIHDFTRDLSNDDHADMIQFWTNGTDAPSSGIMIAGNVLNAGAGHYTQSIFMRNDLVDRGLAGTEMFYRDVVIHDNVILNAHLHGITVGEGRGITITNNTVVRNADASGAKDDPGLWTPQIRVADAAQDVVITHNITAAVTGHTGQARWEVASNLIVQDQDPAGIGYYADIFGPDALRDGAQAAHFRYHAGVGSSLLAR